MSEKHVNIKITASTSGFDSAIKKAQRQIDDLAKEIESLSSSKFGSTLEGQFNDLVKALKEAEEQVDNVKKVLDDLDGTDLSKTEKGLEGIKDKMKDLTESGEKVVKSMDDIQDTLSKVDKSDLGGLDKSFTKVKSTVENLGKEMRDATDNIGKNFSNLAEGADKFSREINDIDGSGIKKISNTFEDVVRDILKTEGAVDDLAKKFKDLDGTINFDSIQKFAKGDLTLAKDIMNDLVENGGDLKKVLSDIDAKGLQGYKDSFYGGKYKSKDSWSDDYNKKNKGGFFSDVSKEAIATNLAYSKLNNTVSGMADNMKNFTEGFREMPNSLQDTIKYFHNLNSEVASNRNRLDELNKEYEDLTNKQKELADSEKAFKNNNDMTNKAIDLAEKYMYEHAERAKELDKAIEKARESQLAYTEDSTKLEGQLIAITDAIEEQRKAYDSIEKTADIAGEGYKKQAKEFENLKKEYNDLWKTIEHAQETDGEGYSNEEIESLIKRNKELEDSLTEVSEKTKQLKKIWDDLSGIADGELYKLEQLEAQKEAIEQQKNALDEQYKAVGKTEEEIEEMAEAWRQALKNAELFQDLMTKFRDIGIDEAINMEFIKKNFKEATEAAEKLKKEMDEVNQAIADRNKEAQGHADGFEKEYKKYESLSKAVKAYLEDEEKSILQREKVAKSFRELSEEMGKVYADSKKFSNAELINDTLEEAAEYIKKLDLSSTKNLQADLKRLGEIIDDKAEKIKRFKALNQEFGSEDSWKAFDLDKQAGQLKQYARTTEFVIEAVDELNKAFAQVKVGDDDNLRIKGRMELLENYGELLARTAADIRNKYHDIEKAEDVYNAATPQERKELDKYDQWKKNRKEIEKTLQAIDEYRAAVKDMGGQVDSKFLDEFGKFDARKFIEDFDKMGTSSAVLQKQLNANRISLLESIRAEEENKDALREAAKATKEKAKTSLEAAKADQEAAQSAADSSKKMMQMANSTAEVSEATAKYYKDCEKLAEATEKVAKAQEDYKKASDDADNWDDKRAKRRKEQIEDLNKIIEKYNKIGMAGQKIKRQDIEGTGASTLASRLDDLDTFGDNLPKSITDIKESIMALFRDLDGFKLDGVFSGLKEIGAGVLSKIPTELKVAATAALAFGAAMKKCAEIGINQFGRGMDTIKNGLSKFTSMARDVGQEVRDAFENITGMHLDASSLMEIPVEFESVMYQVGAITGTLFDSVTGEADATNAAFQQLIDKARQVGGETRYSATEAAEAMVLLGQSGWTAKDMMEGLDSVLHMATIENMSLADSASFLSDALNTMGMQTYQASDAADMLVATSISANTSVSQLKMAYGNAASTAGTLGVSMSDLNTVLGVMADKGIKGAKAGTALKNLMANMSAPTEKQTKCIKEYNLEAAQTAITNGKLVEGVQLMQGKLEGLSAKQKTAVITTIAGKEALSGVAALMNTSAEDMNKLKFAVDSSTKSSKKYAESLGLIDKAGNMIDKTTGKITDSFTDMKNSQGKAYEQWVNFNDIMNSTDDAGNSLVDIMQVVGGSATDLGAIVHKLGEDGSVTKDQVGEVVEVFNKLNEAAQDGSSVLDEFGIEVAETSEGTIDFGETLKNLGAKWDTLTDAQKANMAEQLGISGSIEELNELFADNGEQIESLITAYEEMEGVAEHVAEAFDANFKGALLSLASAMQERLLQVFDKIKPAMQGVVDDFTEFFRIWNNMGQENDGLSGLSGAFEYLEKASQGWGKSLESALSNAINSLNNFINDGAFDNMLQVGTNIINGICDGIKNAEGLESAITGAIDKVVNWVSNNMPAIIEAGGKIVDAICQGISDNGDAIGDIISQVLQMQTDIDAAISKEKWTIIGENLGTFITGGIEAKVKPFFSGFTGWLEGTFKGTANPPKNMGLDLFGNPQMSLFDPKAWTVGSYEGGVEAGKSFTLGMSENLNLGEIFTSKVYAEDSIGGATPIGIINKSLAEGKAQTDETAASIGQGISDNIIAKLETMDAAGLQALGLELQNLQTTVGTVATAMGTSFTQIQDASRVSFMGLANIVSNQMTNVANSIRTQMVNCANIFRNQFVSMANVARNQMVNVSNIVRNQAVSWSNVIRNQVTNARNALTSQFLSMAAVARTQMVNISNIVRNQATTWANIIRNQAANAKSAMASSFAGMASAAASGMAKCLSVVRSYMSQIVAATNRTMTMNFKVNRSITTTNTVRTVAAPAAASAMYAANAASTYSLRSGDASTLASRASSAITTSSSKGAVSSNKNDGITLEIPVMLDGKELARGTAQYVDGELKMKQKRDDRKRGVK
jgi:TP901 family phage tail tape measure protein